MSTQLRVMNFLIADTFVKAVAKLDNQSQKAAKLTALDLQMDPTGKGKSFHRIDKSRDEGFWSVRASRDIRLIVHKAGDRMVLCYVDHHDEAYAWAERRVFETHPTTRALQIVEIEERVEQPPAQDLATIPDHLIQQPVLPLAECSDDDLLQYGVPPSWLKRLRKADTDQLLDLASHLPQEAQEAVLALAIGETPQMPAIEPEEADEALHPDAQRRFRFVEGREELETALNYPWDRWTVFLHPSQHAYAYRDYTGPARIGGSAGTGKTVVALHRAKWLSEKPDGKVLLSTFSRPLATALKRKIGIMTGDERSTVPAMHVASFVDAASELYTLHHGREPYLAKEADQRRILAKHTEHFSDFSDAFLWTEWRDVIDGWQLGSLEEYLDVSRTGRRSRIGRKQREILWPAFEATRQQLTQRGMKTSAMLFEEVTNLYQDKSDKPYSAIVIDEAQDLGPPELRFFAAISDPGNNDLFFAGDLGQQIFQHPFSWKQLGIDVRGRSATLTVNYRTSHQIRKAADKLLPEAMSDLDGITSRRKGTVSLFNGPAPQVMKLDDQEAEIAAVAKWLEECVAEGIEAHEIGVFVRDRDRLSRARDAVAKAGLEIETLSGSERDTAERVAVGIMHLAKGLEFKVVAVMACDEEAMPLQSRIEQAVDEKDLDEVYDTERHLLYVACTRARERLLITGTRPASEFLDDFAN
nr:3'-5' exonuclease [Parvularcula sp. IMCC14364]